MLINQLEYLLEKANFRLLILYYCMLSKDELNYLDYISTANNPVSIRKLIAIPLTSFFSKLATFYGNIFFFSQCFLSWSLLFSQGTVTLPSRYLWNTQFKSHDRGYFMVPFFKKMGAPTIRKSELFVHFLQWIFYIIFFEDIKMSPK